MPKSISNRGNRLNGRGSSLSTIITYWLILLSIQAHAQSSSTRRPNILLLLTDDQDVVLEGTKYMPRLRQLMAKQGTTFNNFFVHTPVCCPSRASILSGRYLHNMAMTDNSIDGNCYGTAWRANTEKKTFAVIAQKAGYQTAYAGKYLNQYACRKNAGEKDCPVPPGWDRWMGLIGNSRYYNCLTINRNGTDGNVYVKQYGMSYEDDYFSDVVANMTIRSIRTFSQQEEPFLIVAAWPAPHAPCAPAPQDKESFLAVKRRERQTGMQPRNRMLKSTGCCGKSEL
ncbi:hypothetical protein MPSEU_000048600 [Mayamaea pseudoterrestris]|nr:hypothetical protein MPSEU_000048600 [Mayamaea pseudoterrestris]